MNDRNMLDLNVFSAIGYLHALFQKKYAETKYRKCRKSVIDMAMKYFRISLFKRENLIWRIANLLLILSLLLRENI